MQENKKFIFMVDWSLTALVFSNVFAIYSATTQGWNLVAIMLAYWFQSVTIGIFNFVRILSLKEFSTENFKINGRPAQPTIGTKIFTAFFFLFHYGVFHLAYLGFILKGGVAGMMGGLDSSQLKYVFGIALIFFGNHLFSYVYNKPRDTKKQNIGVLMFYPYARIIPMHLTIVFGFGVTEALPMFMWLKTGADVIMHFVEHKIRKGEEPAIH